ncbi:MAG: hypothetical protein ACOC1U_00145 [Spirochaetota bacterium]
MDRSQKRAVWSLILMLVALTVVCAQDDGVGTPVAGSTVLLIVSAQSDDSATVRRVVASSVELYLQQEGILVLQADALFAGSELTPELARAAGDRGADFVLLGTVARDGNAVDVDLVLYLTEARELLARAGATEPVGLTLDRAIAGLTSSLVEQARDYFVAAAAERDSGGAGSAGVGEGSRRSTATGTGEATGASAAGAPGAGGATSVAPARRDRLFVMSGGYAPFVPVDPTSDYLELSLQGATVALYTLPFPVDVVGFGLLARGIVARAQGAATTADLQLVPLALVVRVADADARVAPYLVLGGGAGFLRAVNATLGEFWSIVPYATAEIGMEAAIAGPLGIQLSVGFDALLESSLWIFGFSPGIGLTVGL